MTSRRAQRRALQRALDADTVNDAYDATGAAVCGSRARREDHPLTTGRATEPQTSAGKAEEAPIHGPGRGGRDRRTAQEHAADLASETERSLRRAPKRWKWQRTVEVADSRHPRRKAEP
jgi:hypothetical protein